MNFIKKKNIALHFGFEIGYLVRKFPRLLDSFKYDCNSTSANFSELYSNERKGKVKIKTDSTY